MRLRSTGHAPAAAKSDTKNKLLGMTITARPSRPRVAITGTTRRPLDGARHLEAGHIHQQPCGPGIITLQHFRRHEAMALVEVDSVERVRKSAQILRVSCSCQIEAGKLKGAGPRSSGCSSTKHTARSQRRGGLGRAQREQDQSVADARLLIVVSSQSREAPRILSRPHWSRPSA